MLENSWSRSVYMVFLLEFLLVILKFSEILSLVLLHAWFVSCMEGKGTLCTTI